jgi:hypothetical protein
VLVLGGLTLGFIPGLPIPSVNPNIVLFVFLPPLIYAAAFGSSAQDLRTYVRPIGLLAVGLVLVTMAGVAVVAHAVAGSAGDPRSCSGRSLDGRIRSRPPRCCGGVSLAAALALPLTVVGRAFPERATLIFVAYIAIAATLVIPGLTSRAWFGGSGWGRRRRARGARRALVSSSRMLLFATWRSWRKPSSCPRVEHERLHELRRRAQISAESQRRIEHDLDPARSRGWRPQDLADHRSPGDGLQQP